MALVKTKVGFPFVKGMGTKASEKTQAAGELRDCVNFTVNKLGRLDQREGFARYEREIPAMGGESAGTLSKAKAMGHLGDEVIVFDGESAYSKTTDDKWVNVGKLLNVRNSVTPVNKDMQSTAGNTSYGVSGDFEYLAWAEQPYDSGGIGASTTTGSNPRYKYMVRDRKTGATVVPTTTLQSMGTSYTHGGLGSWPHDGSASKIKITLNPEADIAESDWLEVTDTSGGTQKHRVISVTAASGGNPAYALLDTALTGTATSEAVTVWKGQGQDSLYFSPRIRVLCPVGTDHVCVFLQDGPSLKYYYANTGNGTHEDLELDSSGTLLELNRAFPSWECDWFLSTNSSIVIGDAGIAVTYLDTDKDVALRLYEPRVGGSLPYYATTTYPTDSGGANYIPRTIRRKADSLTGIPEDASPMWQLFLKTIHDESAGVPQASRDSTIVLGFTNYGLTGGSGQAHSRIFAFDDAAASLWHQQMFDSANTGVANGEPLVRAGISYDATHIHIMAEVQPYLAAGDYAGDTQIIYSRMARSNGSHSAVDERALWSNASIHSDGFVPEGSSSGRCYFWLSSSILGSELNSILFLADTDGYIHAHGVQGYSPWNKALELAQHLEDQTIVRNMSGMIARSLPLRWHDSGSSAFVAGSSMADRGAKFLNYKHCIPALLHWDTDPERPLRSQESNGLLYIGGGLLWAYDGDRLIENDFLQYPLVSGGSTTTPVAGTTNLPAGTYSYYFAFEYRDDSGAIHSSRPAGPEIVTKSNTDDIEFRIYLSQITNHRFTGTAGNPADYSINIYRTNTDDTRHFLHSSLKVSDWGDSFAPAALYVDYIDDNGASHSDSTTDVALWDAVSPAFASSPISSPIEVTRHKDSLMVSNTENVLYSSLGLSTVTTAMFPQIVGENTSHFGMFGDSTTSPITHVATNGPTCVFFTRDDGFVFGGEGPDMFGTGEWSRPEKLAPGQGVRANGFIAAIPMGVLYSSHNGIYLVGRDLQVANLGVAVDDYSTLPAANDPVIIDAKNEVWIPIKGGSSTERTILVYNYLTKTWYRHEIGNSTFHPGANAELVAWIDDSDEVILYLVDSQGYLYRQKGPAESDAYVDIISGIAYPDSHHLITSSLKTSWLQIPGYGDKSRCYRIALLGTWLDGGSGTTTLSVKTSTNFNNAAHDEEFAASVNATGIGAESGLTGSSQVILKPRFQKMESISLEISTVSTGGSSRGWSLEGLLMEIGKRPDPTRFKLGSTKTIAGS